MTGWCQETVVAKSGSRKDDAAVILDHRSRQNNDWTLHLKGQPNIPQHF